MTKKTKKIILWMAGLFVISNLFFGVITLVFKKVREDINVTTEHKQTVEVPTTDIKGDSLLLERCHVLYEKLLKIKDEREFKKYGFGSNRQYQEWMDKIKNFSSEESNRLMRAFGIVPGDIEMLGLEYASSKGKETKFSTAKRKELDALFANPTRIDVE